MIHSVTLKNGSVMGFEIKQFSTGFRWFIESVNGLESERFCDIGSIENKHTEHEAIADIEKVLTELGCL